MAGELKTAWFGFVFGSMSTIIVALLTTEGVATALVYYLSLGSIALAAKDKDAMVFDAIEAFWRNKVKGNL